MTRARDLGDFIADGATDELVVDTTTLVVDSSNNRVGVGTASPSQALDVNGTGNFTAISLGGTAITATATELNYVDGVSSGIQTQLDAKAPLASPTFTGDVTIPDKIVHTGDTNTAIRFPAADTVAFETAGSERFRFGSAGQLGVAGANYGTSGQVLQSGGASGAASWADAASSAVSFTAQADGAIDANRVAAYQSDGTMKALFDVSSGSTINITGDYADARRIQVTPVTENLYFYAWDADNSSVTNKNKVALVQKSSGTVSANALTVGTIVDINTDQPRLNDAVYDPDNQRITYFWATSGSSTINYRMYSFSGTTLTQTGSGSFSVTNLNTNYPSYFEATYNTTHNCIVFIYKTTDAGAYQIQLIDPGTTSLTFSSNLYAFGNYNSYTGRSVECAATGAHVFAVQKVSDSRVYVRAGTISGSGSSLALSLGSEVDVSTSNGYGGNSPIGIFDVPENTNYTNTMCVQHANSSTYAKYCLFSLSGTTITAKTQATPYIASGGGDTLEGAYIKTKGTVMQVWTVSNQFKQRPIDVTLATPAESGDERAIAGTISGSHGTSRTPIANGPGSDYCVTGFVQYTSGTYPKAQAIAQADNNFSSWAGYTESAVSNGATGTFIISGPISGTPTANPQTMLFVDNDGSLSTTDQGNDAKIGITIGGGNGIIMRAKNYNLYTR